MFQNTWLRGEARLMAGMSESMQIDEPQAQALSVGHDNVEKIRAGEMTDY